MACVIARLVILWRARGLIVAAGTPFGHPSTILAVPADEETVPLPVEVAAVLGAGLRPDGTPTALLAQRVEAGVDLVEAGYTTRLMLSGVVNHDGDELIAMRDHALACGLGSDHIELDYEGVDTAATCRSLKRRYGQVRVALVTQEFHAARAAMLAVKGGLDVVVVATPDATIRPRALLRARIREFPASIKALMVDRV